MTVLFWDIDGTLLTTAKGGVPAWEQAVREVTNQAFDLAQLPQFILKGPKAFGRHGNLFGSHARIPQRNKTHCIPALTAGLHQ